MQLCCQQTRAFTFLECSKTQEEVAEDLGVSVRTIQRLSVKAKEHSLNRHQWGLFFPISSSSSWVSNLPASSSQQLVQQHQQLVPPLPGRSCCIISLQLPFVETTIKPPPLVPSPPPNAPSSRVATSVHLPHRSSLLLLAEEHIADIAAANRTRALMPVERVLMSFYTKLHGNNQPCEPPLKTSLVAHMQLGAGAGRQPHLVSQVLVSVSW